MKKDDLVSNILKSYFEEKTVKELRQLSKEKGLTGYSKQKKKYFNSFFDSGKS